jgi:hypothetical protein
MSTSLFLISVNSNRKEFEGIVIWHRDRLEKMAKNRRRNSFYFSRIFFTNIVRAMKK